MNNRRSGLPQSPRGRFLLGGFFLLCALVMAGSGIYQMAAEALFSSRAETAWARVDDIRTVRQARSTAHFADLRFQTRDGQLVEVPARRLNSPLGLQPGETALIHYDPEDPAQTRLEPLSVRLVGAAMTLPVGIAFGAVGVFIAVGRTRGVLWALGGCLAGLLLSLALLLFANQVENLVELRRDTLRAEGEVVGHRQMPRGQYGALHAPLIRFSTEDGRSVVAQPDAWSTLPEPVHGTAVAVRYRPHEPERAMPDDAAGPWLRIIGAGILPVLLAGLTWHLVGRFRRHAQPTRTRRA